MINGLTPICEQYIFARKAQDWREMSEDNNNMINDDIESTTDIDETEAAVFDEADTAEDEVSYESSDYSQTNDTSFESSNYSQTNDTPFENAAVKKGSKKLAAVYAGIIIILVAVIAVFAILIITKMSDDSADDKNTDKVIESTDSTVDVTTTPEASVTTQVTPVPTTAPVDYNVSVTLGEYRGIEVDYGDTTVSDEDIDYELEMFAADCAEYIEITDRTVESGDTVNIDFTGYMDGEPFEGGSATGHDLDIGSHSFIDGFEEGLIGAAVGETRSLELNFPDPYTNNPDYSGLPVVFEVTVNSISVLEVPELTDELIAENTEYTSVEAYRQFIADSLLSANIEYADQEANYAIIEQVLANTSFGGDIDAEIAAYAEEMFVYYDNLATSYYGVDGETLFLYMYGYTAEQYKELINDEAEYAIKYQYTLDAIAEKEALSVSTEEYDETFNTLFIETYGYTTAEEVYAAIGEEEAKKLVNEAALREKAEALILENAIINK